MPYKIRLKCNERKKQKKHILTASGFANLWARVDITKIETGSLVVDYL